MPHAELTQSQPRLYDHWPLDQTNTKQIILLKLRRGWHRDARASRGREGGGENRGEEKKERREWRAGEKTTLTALRAACSAIAERSGPRLSGRREVVTGSALMRK